MREVKAPVLSHHLTPAAYHPLTQPPCLTEHCLGSVDSATPENTSAQTCAGYAYGLCLCVLVLLGAQGPRRILVCCFGLFWTIDPP